MIANIAKLTGSTVLLLITHKQTIIAIYFILYMCNNDYLYYNIITHIPAILLDTDHKTLLLNASHTIVIIVLGSQKLILKNKIHLLVIHCMDRGRLLKIGLCF